MADRCEKVATEIHQRVAAQANTHRIVSLHDRDARPIRKGKLGSPATSDSFRATAGSPHPYSPGAGVAPRRQRHGRSDWPSS
ncbi:MAG: hypothetical protein ACRDL5_15995 [Solirubrobacteraceae bacterium]